MGFVDRFRSTFAAKAAPPSAATLRTLLADAEAAAVDAEARAAEIETGRADALIAGPAAVAAFRKRVAEAADDAADARAAAASISARLVEVERAEAEAERRATFDGAKDTADRVAKRVRTEYPKVAAALRALVREIADADAAVARANAALPSGAEPLTGPEGLVRDVAGSPARVLRDEIVELWARAGVASPAPDQDAVTPNPGGRTGFIATDGRVRGSILHERRRFRRVETIPAINAAFATRLAAIALPGLRAGDPDILPGFDWSAGPEGILATLDRLAGEKPAAPARPEPVVTFVPVTELAVAAE